MKSKRTSGKSGTKSRERKNNPRSGGARNHGAFAEASRIPGDSREATARLAGVTSTGWVTDQTVEAERLGRKAQLYVIGLEPDRSGGPTHIAAGRMIVQSHFEMVADRRAGLDLGDRVKLRRTPFPASPSGHY